MNKITKTGIDTTKLTVLDPGDQPALIIVAPNSNELNIRSNAVTVNTESITIPSAEVHIQNSLTAAEIASTSISADTANIGTLNVNADITGNTIKANNIELADSLYFYPAVPDGRSLTPKTLHAAVREFESAIAILEDQTDRSFDNLSAVQCLAVPSSLDGGGTGSIANFTSATLDTLRTSTIETNTVQAGELKSDSLEAGNITATQLNASTAKLTGALSCGDVQTKGSLTVAKNATVTGTATISTLKADTIKAMDSDVGLTIMGNDVYSYIWQSYAGLNVKNSQAIKFELDHLNGLKTSIAIAPGTGITLRENNIVVPNAASAIHALTQLITDSNLTDLNLIEQQIEQLRIEVNETLSQSYLTTLLEVPTDMGNFEIAQCSTQELTAGTGLVINRIIMTAKNTNTTTPVYLSVYKVKNQTKSLLSVSDEPITWTDGEKAEWCFDETPFTVEAGTDYLTIQLILNKNAPDTVVTSASLQFRTFMAPGRSNCRSLGAWNNGRTPYIKFAGYGTMGQLVEDMQSAQSQIAALVAEDVKLQQELDSAENEVATLQTDVNLLTTSVADQAVQIEQLQDKVDSIAEGGSGSSASGYGISRASGTLFITEDGGTLRTEGIHVLELTHTSTGTGFNINAADSLMIHTTALTLSAPYIYFTRSGEGSNSTATLIDTEANTIRTECVYVADSTERTEKALDGLTNASKSTSMALTFTSVATGMCDLRLRSFIAKPCVDIDVSFYSPSSLLLYNNCVNNLGTMEHVGGSPVEFLKLEIVHSAITPLLLECELWFKTGSYLPSEIKWPDNTLWISVMPDLEPNTYYRLAARKEPVYGTCVGPLVLNPLYWYSA